jgi:hypothetical protein
MRILSLVVFCIIAVVVTSQSTNSTDYMWWNFSWTKTVGPRNTYNYEIPLESLSTRWTITSTIPLDFMYMTTKDYFNYVNKLPYDVLAQAMATRTFAGQFSTVNVLRNGTVLVAVNGGSTYAATLNIQVSALLPTYWRQLTDLIGQILGAIFGTLFLCCVPICCCCVALCCACCLVVCCRTPSQKQVYLVQQPTVYVEKQALIAPTQQFQQQQNYQPQFKPQYQQQQPQHQQPQMYGSGSNVYPQI